MIINAKLTYLCLQYATNIAGDISEHESDVSGNLASIQN